MGRASCQEHGKLKYLNELGYQITKELWWANYQGLAHSVRAALFRQFDTVCCLPRQMQALRQLPRMDVMSLW